MNKSVTIVFILMLMIACFPKRGFCYIDPGTGSFILQMVAAFFLGALFTIKVFWKKIKGFLSNLSGKNKNGRE